MIVMEWPEKVNKKVSINGNYSQEGGFKAEIKFESGKRRTWQKNSYIPMEYPDLSLFLNNVEIIDKGWTEKQIFDHWYKVVLRNGTLPFYFPNLENVESTAVYEFMSETKYDKTEGIVQADFGFREVSQMSGEPPSNLWVTLEDQDESDALPSSGKVGAILQTVRNILKWLKGRFHVITGHKHNGIDSPKVSYNNLLDTENLENNVSLIANKLDQETVARIIGDENLQTLVNTIITKIPNQASMINQLADKDFVNSSIANMATNYVTPNAAGDQQWASLTALNAGPWFYRGTSYTPTKNDYAIFLESDNSVWRSTHDGLKWNKSYKVNDRPFTAAELAALASGITAALVELIRTAIQPTTNLTIAADSTQTDIGTGSITDTVSGLIQRLRRGINHLKNSIETGQLIFKTSTITYNIANASDWSAAIDDINNNAALFQNAKVSILLSTNITVSLNFYLTIPEGINIFTIRSSDTTTRTLSIIGGSSIRGHAGCDFNLTYIRITATSLQFFILQYFNNVYIREYFSTATLGLDIRDVTRLTFDNYISLTGTSSEIYLANIPQVICTLNGVIFRGTYFVAKNCNFYLTGGTSAGLTNAAAQSINNCPVFKENDLQVTIAAPSDSDVQATPAARGLTALAQIFANNIKHLMGNIYTARTDPYNTTFNIPLGYESAKILAITLVSASGVNTSITINFRTAFEGSYVLFRAGVTSVSTFNGSSINFSSMNSTTTALVIFFRN